MGNSGGKRSRTAKNGERNRRKSLCGGSGFSWLTGQKVMGKLWGKKRCGGTAKNADTSRISAAAKGSYGTERISEAKGRTERNGKKLIREGIDEADYASYALRKYGVRPKEWVQMDLAERMFYCAVIDLEIEKMQEAERG